MSTVRVSHSTVNYKDGLAITGKNPVVRSLADDRRNRLRRARSRPQTIPNYAPGDLRRLQRLGHVRNALRRLRREGAGQGRVAGQAACPACRRMTRWRSAPPATHRRCAVLALGTPQGPSAGARAGDRHGRIGRRRRLRADAAEDGRLALHRLHRPRLRKPTTSRSLGADEIIERAELAEKPASRWARSAGRRASTPSDR